MSYQILKQNIEYLIQQNNYTNPSELEKAAGLKHGNVTNILTGKSKRPSAELLLSIANVFGITVEDLLKTPNMSSSSSLTKDELMLFKNITDMVIEEIISQDIKLLSKDLASTLSEVYNYFSEQNTTEPDRHFIKWFLKQKYMP